MGRDDPKIREMTIDVNAVELGTLFVARQDWYGNTHARLSLAVERGASALLNSQGDGANLGGGVSALAVSVAFFRRTPLA